MDGHAQKYPLSAGLLAHVDAGRGEPHFTAQLAETQAAIKSGEA